MNKHIESFLLSAKSNNNAIDFVEVKHKTKSGFGYNLVNVKTKQRYYYHTKQDLWEGDCYLIHFRKSKVCLDRLDVVEAIKVSTYQGVMASLWADPKLKALLTSHFYNSPAFNQWITKAVISEIPETPDKLNDFLRELPSGIKSEIAGKIQLNSLPYCLEVFGDENRVIKYLLTIGLPCNTEDRTRIISHCRTRNLQTALYLTDLLHGEINQKTFDYTLVRKIVDLTIKFNNPKATTFIHSIVTKNNHCFKAFCNLLFEYPRFKYLFLPELISRIPHEPESMGDFLQDFSRPVVNEISKNIPLEHLPSFLEYLEDDSRINDYFLEVDLPWREEDERYVVAYCQKYNLKTHLYWLGLLKGEITRNTFNRELIQEIIELTFNSKKNATDFVESLVNKNPQCYSVFCSLIYEYPKLKALVLHKLIRLPKSYEHLASYLNGFEKELKEEIINRIPLEKLPECIEVKGNKRTVFEYLVQHFEYASTEYKNRLFDYCQTSQDIESLFLISLLEGECKSVSLSNKQVVALFIKFEHSDFVTNLVFKNPLVYKQLANLLVENDVHKKFILDKLVKVILANQDNIKDFINGFSNEIVSYLTSYLPLELIPQLIEYSIPERRVCEYLVGHNVNINTSLLRAYINKHQYCHAELLLNIITSWQQGHEINFYGLNGKIKKYQEHLFTKHSVDRSKIDPFIFARCPVLGHRFLKTQTCCEGYRYYSKQKKQWNVKCRTNLCNQTDNVQFSSAMFYRVIVNLFGINADMLHQNEAYTRTIAALNRWNDILERLHCYDCNKPLSLSEHAKNSMGNMAHGATYWHCANKQCKQYCNSIKLSHCLGCNKVIDSRIDTQSCKPFEIKSYKKFYICNSCSSCCREHSGFSGRCGHCGKNNAYTNITHESYSPRATCRFCEKSVSVNYNSFEKQKELNHIFNIEKTNKPKHTFLACIDKSGQSGVTKFILPWDGKTLYIYDLFYHLQNRRVSLSELSQFDNVYDVKIIERIVDLGLYHKNYNTTATSQNSFEGIFNSIADRETWQSANVLVQERLNYLFNVMNEQSLWHHYENIEMPFMYALNELLGNGFKVEQNEIIEQVSKTELSRNIIVERLRSKGLDTPDHESFKQYIKHVYPDQDIASVVKAIERADYKMLQEFGGEFADMHAISKFERTGALLNQIAQLNGVIKPEYQIMGAETGRCTSKAPNLLGLPKELRPIIKATPQHGIVECDYSQMELGVMAALADDPILIADYNSGDVYQAFGDSLGLPRERAKLVFLSILYGVGVTTLATWLQVTTPQANKLIEAFFTRYKKVKELQDKHVREGDQYGYVTAVTGLRRRLNINAVESASNDKKRFLQHWQHNWFKNFPIQASAAIVFKKAIITLAENNRGGLKLIAPMYDAIVFEASLAELEKYTNAVEAAMIRAMRETFPKLEPRIKINNHDVSCWNAHE